MTAALSMKDAEVSDLFHDLVLKQDGFSFRGRLDTTNIRP